MGTNGDFEDGFACSSVELEFRRDSVINGRCFSAIMAFIFPNGGAQGRAGEVYVRGNG